MVKGQSRHLRNYLARHSTGRMSSGGPGLNPRQLTDEQREANLIAAQANGARIAATRSRQFASPERSAKDKKRPEAPRKPKKDLRFSTNRKARKRLVFCLKGTGVNRPVAASRDPRTPPPTSKTLDAPPDVPRKQSVGTQRTGSQAPFRLTNVI
jgi:hypothetical protein